MSKLHRQMEIDMYLGKYADEISITATMIRLYSCDFGFARIAGIASGPLIHLPTRVGR